MLLDFGIFMGRTTRDHPVPAPAREHGAHDLGDFLAEVVAPLQASLQKAIHSLRTPCRIPADLAKQLGLDRTSAWRVWQAAFAATVEESALALSGETAVERFLDSVEARGGDAAAVGLARERLRHFVDTVATQIGDAATLKMILAAADSQIFDDARSMRLLHDAARLRVGAEADATLRINVRSMSEFEGLVDLASATMYQGLRTLRAATPCVLGTRSLAVINTAARNPKFRNTVFTHQALGDAPTLAEDAGPGMPGAAKLVPMIDAISVRNGRSLWEMESAGRAITCVSGGRTGKRGQSSICYGDVMLTSTTTLAEYDWLASGSDVCVPTETIVSEMYFSQEEHDLGFVYEPRVYENIHGDLAGWGTRHLGPKYPGVFEHFAPGQPRPAMPEFADYNIVTDRLGQRLNTSLADFHLLRWRMNVPIVGSCLLFYFEDPKSDSPHWPLNTAGSSRLQPK